MGLQAPLLQAHASFPKLPQAQASSNCGSGCCHGMGLRHTRSGSPPHLHNLLRSLHRLLAHAVEREDGQAAAGQAPRPPGTPPRVAHVRGRRAVQPALHPQAAAGQEREGGAWAHILGQQAAAGGVAQAPRVPLKRVLVEVALWGGGWMQMGVFSIPKGRPRLQQAAERGWRAAGGGSGGGSAELTPLSSCAYLTSRSSSRPSRSTQKTLAVTSGLLFAKRIVQGSWLYLGRLAALSASAMSADKS